MAKTVFETKRCTRCGSERFAQIRFVACGAETSFRIIGSFDPMGKWHYFYEDLEMWKFPLCDGCLHKGLISHLEFESERYTKFFYTVVTFFIICLLMVLFVINPRPHPWNLLEVAVGFGVFASPFIAITMLIEIVKMRGRQKKLRSGTGVASEEYDSAFSGEAEDIMRVRKGSAAGATFPVPKLGDITPDLQKKLKDASDLTRELKVVAVGKTLQETIERLPNEWKGFIETEIPQ